MELNNIITRIFLSAIYLSDHKLISLHTQLPKPIRSSSLTQITVLKYKNIEDHENWKDALSAESIMKFIELISKIVKDNTELKKCNKPENNEWITTEIRQIIRRREKLFKLKKRYPNNEYLIKRHKEVSKTVVTKIKKAKQNYCSSKIENNLSKPKYLWRYFNKIIFNRDNFKDSFVNLVNESGNIMDYLNVPHIFNKYFATIADEITKQLNHLGMPKLDHLAYSIEHPFQLELVTDQEILGIISSLNRDAAVGVDGISTKVLYRLKDKIVPIITKYVNLSLTNGQFPENLKIAKIIPIYKAGNQLQVENFRPISILPSVSKIFEKVILNRFLDFLAKNNIISLKQFGFCTKSSTLAACLNLTDYLSKQCDLRQVCGCIFLDIRRAFDTVHHDILLHKLEKLKLTACQINLWSTYIKNRKQYVYVNGVASHTLKIRKGVPQGSILGPTLFNFYINDLFHLNLKGKLQLYADDGVIMYSTSNLELLYEQMQHDLDMLKLWFDQNRLVLNIDKTVYMIFKRGIYDDQRLHYDSIQLKKVKVHTYLGLVVDDHLKWHDHIDYIKKIITPYVFALKRINNIISNKQLLQIYNAYIHSRLVYLNPIWSSSANFKIHELEIIQKRALKFIIKVPMHYPTVLLSKKFQLLTEINKYQLILTIYKIVNNLVKHNFEFTRMRETHSYETRRRSDIRNDYFQMVNTSENNVMYRGIPLFNCLPREIKNESNIKSFKLRLMKNLREEY